jgi:predicted amidophosphoribosyltransferase
MRLLEIDDSNRKDHARLTAEDQCYHIYEYTSNRNYAFSATNNLISNLKKKPSTSSPAELRYKRRAIVECADALRAVLNPNWLASATIVPVPGSKAQNHPDFDPRTEHIAKLIGTETDIRKLVVQNGSTAAAHEAAPGERITVQQLIELYSIDEALTTPVPKHIGILDDVLTAGTHFRAMKYVLAARFPDIPIIGLFVARRVFPNEFENLDF